jgi:tyrosyl-tRNA synthetase
MTLSEELVARGFVHQYSAETLTEILDGPRRTVYHGIDPTADSAHAGNFVNWMLLMHLARAGHKVVFLVGGGTGMIGDPKPDVERPLSSSEEVAERVERITEQAERLFGHEHTITFVNNHSWLSDIGLISFLRDIGKHFTVNELLKKDAIASRLKSEEGISYTEFAYPLLQAYDYLQLHTTLQCDLQVGGSDQWGNIIAGVELIRRKTGHTVYALTSKLVIDKVTGKKFGKSEGNAVWLSPHKTSPYHFYQFWLNVADENVIDYLKLFTFLDLSEIDTLAHEHTHNPHERRAQRVLAHHVTTGVHGASVCQAVETVSDILFGRTLSDTLSEADRELLITYAPYTTIAINTPLVDALVATGLASSKREARTFIEQGAIAKDGVTITDTDTVLVGEVGVQHLLARGKKHRALVVLSSV